jgi:hypothetical protein
MIMIKPTSRSPIAEQNASGRREALRRLVAGAAAVPLATLAPAALAEPGWVGDGCGLPPDTDVNPRQGTFGTGGVRRDATFGFGDVYTDLKTAIGVGLGAIPVVGGALAAVVGLLWPVAGGNSVWDKVKDKVEAMIKSEVQRQALDSMKADIAGLQTVLANHLVKVKAYLNSRGDPDQRTRLIASIEATEAEFIVRAAHFMWGDTDEWHEKALPLFAQFATLHLTFYQDILVHGTRSYAFAPVFVDTYLGNFDTALASYVQHADQILPRVRTAIDGSYQQARSQGEFVSGQTSDHFDVIATGAWRAKRDANTRANALVVLVEDFRQLWPPMRHPELPRQPLSRELWYGPYGVPGANSIGAHTQATTIPYGGSLVAPYPDVPAPIASPPQALRYVSVATLGYKRDGKLASWNFPSAIDLLRSNDGQSPPSGRFGISLDERWGGPVVGVRIDSGSFISRTSNFFSSMPVAAGYLCSMLYFTQADGGIHAVGSNVVGKEFRSYSGEDVPVPGSHVLSGVHAASIEHRLYLNTGTDLRSISSVQFGFRLIDPTLTPKVSQLARFLIACPVLPALSDLVAMHVGVADANGVEVTPAAATELLARISEFVDVNELADERELYWQRLEQIAQEQ